MSQAELEDTVNSCPYCGSQDTSLLLRIDETTVERICNLCACTFNVIEEARG